MSPSKRSKPRRIVVTGGAGFIGANFVLDWLRACDEPVVNLDKLTYAGNLGNFMHAPETSIGMNTDLSSLHIDARGPHWLQG